MNTEMQRYQLWLRSVEQPEHREELQSLSGDEAEINDRFYRTLEFGTAGIRGVLGMGDNRMNIYTVRHATQGLAAFLLTQVEAPKVAIAYDSRNLSDVFAREAARVLAANGVRVHLYAELMPTPALSYAVRELRCDAGIVITASHNPARYNGYKAYGPDGCQLGPDQAAAVMEQINRHDLFTGVRLTSYQDALEQKRIRLIPEEFVQQYINRVFQEAVQPEVCGQAGLNLVYTPLNGAGNRCVQTILGMAGVRGITVVPEQEHPDGNFPTCPYPNPELREALELGLALSKDKQADLLLATDPDCDRVAVAVRQDSGDYRILSGNEVGVLLLDYIATAKGEKGTLPQHPVAVRSIVSTPMADRVAESHGVQMVQVLTGFKFIGEVILGLEEKGEEDRFLLGFEESCGYLTGPYVRDKDAVAASLLLVEMASAHKLRGKTLTGRLEELYRQHGVYRSEVDSFAFEGADGMAKMAEIMTRLRENPPASLAGIAVTARADYQTGTRITTQGESSTGLPPSNVLEYILENGCSVIVRPSGTEPKIKIYYTITAPAREETLRLKEQLQAGCRTLVEA